MLLLPIIIFLFVSLGVAAAAWALTPRTSATIERRLGELSGPRVKTPVLDAPTYGGSVTDTLARIGRAAPGSVATQGRLRARLVHAGYRRHEAPAVFVGVQVACAILGFVAFASPILGRPNLLLALGVAGVSYLAPGFVLGRQAKRRQHRIRLSLPDALDLLVVSVEAGLGLDQAIQRVADELAFAHPDLSDELRLITLELRAGTARSEALHHLAERTGVDDVASLVAMLVQTDKFGTSVASSLRVHSDTLRTKRRQRAEEAAAKTGVKMVFPLVFCIFPAIWVVTIGPAAIRFVQVLFPMAER